MTAAAITTVERAVPVVRAIARGADFGPSRVDGQSSRWIGAAILGPSTLALLSTNFREGPERTRAVGHYGAVAGIARASV